MIIGITGRKRHGKGASGALYAEALGADNTVEIGFADPLKEMSYAFNPILFYSPEQEYVRMQDAVDEEGWEGTKDRYPEARRVLQHLGTEFGRAIDPDVWRNLARQKIKAAVAEGKHVILTDLRFQNEADLIWELGGVVVKVIRPDWKDDSNTTHSSETELEGIVADIELINDGTLDDLRAKVVESLA